jgi:4-hydroxy-tetrahydrodipicolinate reductase
VIKVAVCGARGKLGSALVAGFQASGEIDVVAEIDFGDDLSAMVATGAEVLVDVTSPDAVMGNLEFAIDHGIHAVVGTTGFDDARLGQVRSWLGEEPKSGVLICPNFSIGAILMMQFAAKAAPHFESVEIIELHHPTKADAPSGTSARTAELIAAARLAAGTPAAPDATSVALDGARGASVDGIPVHSLRVRGLVAHQEVILGSVGETLTIRHDSMDRSGFAPGAIAGIKGVRTLRGLTVGLENVLDL